MESNCNLIKLTKIVNEWQNHKWVNTGTEPFLLNPAKIITAKEVNGVTHIKWQEALVNGCDVTETLERVYELANSKKEIL